MAPGAARELTEGLLPTVRYATRREPDVAIDFGQTKLGGAPDLARGTYWPAITGADGERKLLQFFAQVDLAEALAAAPAEFDWGVSAGLLSFFAALEPGADPPPGEVPCAVLLSSLNVPMARLGLRIEPLACAQLAPVGTWTWPPLAALPALDGDIEADLLLRTEEPYHLTARHQLGGHCPVPLPDGEVALFQFDSDSSLELTWGAAAGAVVWSLSRASLAAGDWTAAKVRVLATPAS